MCDKLRPVLAKFYNTQNKIPYSVLFAMYNVESGRITDNIWNNQLRSNLQNLPRPNIQPTKKITTNNSTIQNKTEIPR